MGPWTAWAVVAAVMLHPIAVDVVAPYLCRALVPVQRLVDVAEVVVEAAASSSAVVVAVVPIVAVDRRYFNSIDVVLLPALRRVERAKQKGNVYCVPDGPIFKLLPLT